LETVDFGGAGKWRVYELILCGAALRSCKEFDAASESMDLFAVVKVRLEYSESQKSY
jgi:hypothetical protein